MSVTQPKTAIELSKVSSPSLAVKIKALHSETGKFKEKYLTLSAGMARECLLGRHPSCDLVLDSAEVSRIHGRIWCQDGQCFFTDLGSTDGSQIDNEEVQINQSYPLNQNNLLRVGGYVLTIAQMCADENASERQSTVEQGAIIPNQPRQWRSGELIVRCWQVIAETHDVKTFRFVAEPPVLFSYKPGQFVTLDLEIEGKRVMRSYSISSTPSRPDVLEITVKRVPPPVDNAKLPPGLVSNWLHDQITIGSQVKIKGPMGKFTCMDHPAPKLLFISAGSRITPMISMSRWLLDTAADVDIVFIHSARSFHDFIFRHELTSMAARYDNFKLAVTTTRKEPGQAWQGYTGRLNEAMLQAIAPDFQERSVYVCGSHSFLKRVKTLLETRGFPMENYYEESFGAPNPKKKESVKTLQEEGITQVEKHSCGKPTAFSDSTQAQANRISALKKTQARSPVIVFDKSGQEITGDEEDTILESAEEKGIELPSGCRMGACGACKLPLLAGEVNYDDDPACEPGHLLTCIAKPVGQVVIKA